MERIAFKMKLYPGRESEYRKRHDELWPELSVLLKKTGVSDYSIFFDEETHTLFGVLKVSDRELFGINAKCCGVGFKNIALHLLQD